MTSFFKMNFNKTKMFQIPLTYVFMFGLVKILKYQLFFKMTGNTEYY